MNIKDLHNELYPMWLEKGPLKLRQDFAIEDIFEPPHCDFCGDGTLPVLANIAAKFCPFCGRKLRETNS